MKLSVPKFYVSGYGWLTINTHVSKRMSPKRLLKLSILKWKTIVAFMEKYPEREIRDGGKESCACCLVYFDRYCEGCPIYDFTGHTCCDWTPYHEFNQFPTLENAQKEVKFLEKVLKNPE